MPSVDKKRVNLLDFSAGWGWNAAKLFGSISPRPTSRFPSPLRVLGPSPNKLRRTNERAREASFDFNFARCRIRPELGMWRSLLGFVGSSRSRLALVAVERGLSGSSALEPVHYRSSI